MTSFDQGIEVRTQLGAGSAAAGGGDLTRLPVRTDVLRALARCWIVLGGVFYLADLWGQTVVGWSNGSGRPLGDDFLNYWTGAVLAWRERATDVYAWDVYHAFQERLVGGTLDFYHYSYPPTLLVLTAPLAALPYLPALAVWLIASWYAFYRALQAAWVRQGGALALSLATPALFINAVGGQNGAWTAALLGGGLALLDRMPVVAGALFGLLVYKPHLGILVPVALIAGRRWRALVAAAILAAGLVGVSIALFGLEAWGDYARNIAVLRGRILEDGSGVWHRMVSVFVFARRIGLDIEEAYAVQVVSALAAGGIMAWAWLRDWSPNARNALVVLATCLATPYLQDYDLVVGAFVVVWLTEVGRSRGVSMRLAFLAGALVLVVPLVAASVGKSTGLAVGAPLLGLAFIIAVQLGWAESENLHVRKFKREEGQHAVAAQ